MLERVTGIVIKTQDYGETHKIVTIFSGKYGKLTALARGAKKPSSRMAAVSQPFVYGEFLIYIGKGLGTIQQGDIINSNRKIRENIHKTTYASYIAEITVKTLPSREQYMEIFNEFMRTLSWIAEHNDSMVPIMMYELKLYKEIGTAPVLDNCVLCTNSTNLEAFSITEGGFLCKDCLNKDKQAIKLSQTLIKLLQILSLVNLDQVGTITVKEKNIQKLRFILDEYYDRYGGYYLKTRNVLKQLDLLT